MTNLFCPSSVGQKPKVKVLGRSVALGTRENVSLLFLGFGGCWQCPVFLGT